jgi:uncharacterized protein YndB with AHSA1/START domain
MINTIDIQTQIGAIERSVARTPRDDGGENVTVVARRVYAADLADTWSALTDPSRIARWLMRISGDLRQGGHFQLEDMAGGSILECEPPHRFRVTYGDETSILEVRLTPQDDDATTLELEHSVPIEMAQSGAGALWVGPGWDGGLLALARHLAGEPALIGLAGVAPSDPTAVSPEAVAFGRDSVRAWADAVTSSRTATDDQLAEAIEMSMAQFAPRTDENPR